MRKFPICKLQNSFRVAEDPLQIKLQFVSSLISIFIFNQLDTVALSVHRSCFLGALGKTNDNDIFEIIGKGIIIPESSFL